MFEPNGNSMMDGGMMGSGMMTLNNAPRIRFHYNEDMLRAQGKSESQLVVKYFDRDNQWKLVSGTVLNTEANTIEITSNPVASYYALFVNTAGVTAVGENSAIPSAFVLSQNYPNPFNPETAISFQLPEAGKVKLAIYNLLGEEVLTLVDAEMSSGTYTTRWNATNSHGRVVPSGIYLYRLEANEVSQVKKMTLLK
jgi:hypothetical protein